MRSLFDFFIYIAPLDMQDDFAQAHRQICSGSACCSATAASHAGKNIGIFFYQLVQQVVIVPVQVYAGAFYAGISKVNHNWRRYL